MISKIRKVLTSCKGSSLLCTRPKIDFVKHDLGPPTHNLVPPGECQFNQDWVPVTLKSRKNISHDTSIFTFSLPNTDKPLGLSTCACILVKGTYICI